MVRLAGLPLSRGRGIHPTVKLLRDISNKVATDAEVSDVKPEAETAPSPLTFDAPEAVLSPLAFEATPSPPASSLPAPSPPASEAAPSTPAIEDAPPDVDNAPSPSAQAQLDAEDVESPRKKLKKTQKRLKEAEATIARLDTEATADRLTSKLSAELLLDEIHKLEEKVHAQQRKANADRATLRFEMQSAVDVLRRDLETKLETLANEARPQLARFDRYLEWLKTGPDA